MKKVIYISLAALFMAACSDDNEPQVKPNATPGQDVQFSSSVNADGSRTIYADAADGNAWPIYWVNGDMINVYSPEGASGFTQAPYKVVNTTDAGDDNNGLNYAMSLEHTTPTGVRWGDGETANFYAVYPYDENLTQFTSVGTSHAPTAVATVASYQTNSAPLVTTSGSVFVKGDMKNNVMYACNLNVPNGTNPVNLRFTAASTVLQVKLGSLQITGTRPGYQDLTVQEISITAPEDGPDIAGDLNMSFGTTQPANAPILSVSGNTSKTVTLATQYNGVNAVIPAGGSMTANIFLAVPTEHTSYDITKWTIRVVTNAGTFSKTLATDAANVNKDLIPGEIHQLNLPNFTREGEWTYQLNSWMSTVPRTVYVSELSLPGAWYAGSPESGYQAATGVDGISTLFDAGVRAFGLETRTGSTNVAQIGWRYVPSGIVISGTGRNSATSGNGYYNGTSISNVISAITNKVAGTQEFCVLVLSYADGGEGGHRYADYAYWLQGINTLISNLNQSVKDNIYSTAITPNTTIKDVQGKLIIKLNVDNRIVTSGSGSITGTTPGTSTSWNYSYTSGIPALLSYTDLMWESSYLNTSLISQMYWSVWDNSYKSNITNNDISTTSRANLYWNYSVANRTATNGTSTDIPTYENRQRSLTTMMENSDVIYKQSSHNVWFYFGAGGTEATSSVSKNPSPTKFASNMNKWVLEQINNKITNNRPSPLGIVICNQISNSEYNGPEIVKAIIDMNNKFYLQRDETATVDNNPASYSGGSFAAAEGWDNITGHLK